MHTSIGKVKRLVLLCLSVLSVYSCTENIDTSARYVFKEETISSYLSKQEIYSEYYDLLGRVPISDMSETTVLQLMPNPKNSCLRLTYQEVIGIMNHVSCFPGGRISRKWPRPHPFL